MARPYRPADEALASFEERFCDHCHHFPDNGRVCPIWARAMAYQPGDINFPGAWIADLDGPRCTAFADRARPLDAPAPCPDTLDLFERRA